MRRLHIKARFFEADVGLDHDGICEAPERLAFLVEHRWPLSRLLVYAKRRGWLIRDVASGEILNAPRHLRAKLKWKLQ